MLAALFNNKGIPELTLGPISFSKKGLSHVIF